MHGSRKMLSRECEGGLRIWVLERVASHREQRHECVQLVGAVLGERHVREHQVDRPSHDAHFDPGEGSQVRPQI